jgi:hypothetical protein
MTRNVVKLIKSEENYHRESRDGCGLGRILALFQRAFYKFTEKSWWGKIWVVFLG